MQDCSDNEEDVVRCFDRHERDSADLNEDDCEPDFVDLMHNDGIETNASLDLDSEAEIYIFLAILLHIRLVKKTLITDYWRTDITITSLFAAICMDSEKFCSILSFFHINKTKTSSHEASQTMIHSITFAAV
ncbi:hypothetical protein PoB_004103700 [Plakobranchus ocellatus]|uniref:PiggyBac transposable element-derived protein domain-containing protein n=1 Tax=Plakobranchus ocellatus TaxID=259542 RepID=A0AAV4B5S5_9GAST|nr:hypothetical protein PoB_004103700 [Plakobranchus ocellatus]